MSTSQTPTDNEAQAENIDEIYPAVQAAWTLNDSEVQTHDNMTSTRQVYHNENQTRAYCKITEEYSNGVFKIYIQLLDISGQDTKIIDYDFITNA